MFYANKSSSKVVRTLLQAYHASMAVSVLPPAVEGIVRVAGFGVSADVLVGKKGHFRVSVHTPFGEAGVAVGSW